MGIGPFNDQKILPRFGVPWDCEQPEISTIGLNRIFEDRDEVVLKSYLPIGYGFGQKLSIDFQQYCTPVDGFSGG